MEISTPLPDDLHNDLTIVIATHNSEKFIRDTIVNALAAAPAKIIISDDASLDDTERIVNSCVSLYPEKILFIKSETNVGLTNNWNRALSFVDTTYCLKLDHDDLIFPGYVSAAADFLRKNEAVGIIAGKSLKVESGDLNPKAYNYFERCFEDATNVDIIGYAGIEACKFILRWEPYAFSSSTIFRMTAWNNVAGFDVRLSYCNDREIWFRIAECFDIAFYGGLSGIQRLHASNFTKTVVRNDRACIEFDYMFTKALSRWGAPELKQLFRKKLVIVGKAYLGSAWRCLPTRASEIPYRVFKAITTLARALIV